MAEGLTTTKVAPHLGVNERTVRAWIKKGLPTCGTLEHLGRTFPLVDPEQAKAWMAKHVNPTPPSGGALPGGGRKPYKHLKRDLPPPPVQPQQPIDSQGREERIARIHAGTATKAELDFTDAETATLKKIDAYNVEQGRLIARDEAEAAWGEMLQAHKLTCQGIGAQVEAEAGAELHLSAEQGQAVRRIVEARINAAFVELMARDPLEGE